MKRTSIGSQLLFVSVIGAAIAAGPGFARADGLSKAPVSAPYNWSGFYVGAHLGAGWERSQWTDLDPFCPNALLACATNGGPFGSHNLMGLLAGGQVGVNWQVGRLVWGLEGQLSWANLNGDHSHSDSDAATFINGTVPNRVVIGVNTDRDSIATTSINRLATIAARLGVTSDQYDRTLFYIKAGAGFANPEYGLSARSNQSTECSSLDPGGFCPVIKASVTSTSSGSTSKALWGPMVGIGIEHALTASWSVRVEYDYVWFGKRDVSIPFTGQECVGINGFPPNCSNIAGVRHLQTEEDLHMIKFGLNYRFK